MPSENKRFSVPFLCWHLVHISSADKHCTGAMRSRTESGPGRDPQQSSLWFHPAELSCKVLHVNWVRNRMCCWWVRWDACWSLLPYGEARPCKGHETTQSTKKLGNRDKDHRGAKALVGWGRGGERERRAQGWGGSSSMMCCIRRASMCFTCPSPVHTSS